MISARQIPEAEPDLPAPTANDYISPAPRVSVQAFCSTAETAAAAQAAGEGRRLAKTHLTVKMGGIAVPFEPYRTQPAPNVIMLETEANNAILAGLDELASVC